MFRSVLFTLITLSTAATAQTYAVVEAKFQVEHSLETIPTLDVLVGHRYGQWGLSAFFLVTEGWAQAYVGPTYAPADWVELSINIGAQHSESGLDLRYATTVWFGYQWFEFLGIAEFDNLTFQGDDIGLWYELTATGKPVEWFATGLRVQRSGGLGPYFRFNHAGTGLGAWLHWSPVDQETGETHLTRFMVGATLSL